MEGTECGGLATCATCFPLFLVLPQRQKSTYTYPKAEPAPVASSAPPASSLYASPVVSACSNLVTLAWVAFHGKGQEGCPGKDSAVSRGLLPSPRSLWFPGQGFPVGAEEPVRLEAPLV